jgi:LacI family transcriptional regulator
MTLPTVVSDNVAAANEATTHLINEGHRRIGVLAGRRTLDFMGGRVEGCRGALLEHRVKFDETLVVDGIEWENVILYGQYVLNPDDIR